MADESVKIEISAVDRASEVFKDLSRSSGDLVQNISSALTPTRLLGGLIGYELANAAKNAIEHFQKFAFQVRDLSYLSGAGAQEVGYLVTALEDLGVDASTVERGLVMMSRAIEAGSPALNRLGVSVTNSSGQMKNGLTLFYETIDALGKMQAGTERNSIAQEIFGRGWISMVPALAKGSDELRRMGEENAKLGKGMSEDGIRAAEAYHRALNELRDILEGLTIEVGRELVPSLTVLFRTMGPVAIDTGRVMIGVFQEIDATLTLAAASVFAFIKPFAYLTDLVGLSQGAFEKWAEWRDIALGASLSLASKGLSNLSLQTGSVTEATKKATEAETGYAGALGATDPLLQLRLKIAKQLADLDIAAQAARAVGEEDKLAVAIRAVNAERKQQLDLLKMQYEEGKLGVKGDPRTEQDLANLRVAVNAKADAQIEKLHRDLREERAKRDVELFKNSANVELDIAKGFADSDRLIAEQTAEQRKRMREGDLADAQREAEALAAFYADMSGAGVKAEADAFAVRQRIREKYHQDSLGDIRQERDDLTLFYQMGIITAEDYYRNLARLREKEVETHRQDVLDRFYTEQEYFAKVGLALRYHLGDWRSTDQTILDITRELGQNLQRTLSDTFFDVFTGQLNDLEDVWTRFWKSLVRTASDELSKLVMNLGSQLLFGGGGGAGGGGSAGGLLSSVLGLGNTAANAATGGSGGGGLLGTLGEALGLPAGGLLGWLGLSGGTAAGAAAGAAGIGSATAIGGGLTIGAGEAAVGTMAGAGFLGGEAAVTAGAAGGAIGGEVAGTAAAGTLGLGASLGLLAAPVAFVGIASLLAGFANKWEQAHYIEYLQLVAEKSMGASGDQLVTAVRANIGVDDKLAGALSYVLQARYPETWKQFEPEYTAMYGPKSAAWEAAQWQPDTGRQAGGPVWPGQPYWVGERGPELFVPRQSGTILPTENSARAMGGDLHVHIDIDARGSLLDAREFTELVRTRIIPEIAHAMRLRHGPRFSGGAFS